MILKYGLGSVTIDGLDNTSVVKIKFRGKFFIIGVNKNYTIERKDSIIIATPKRNSYNDDTDEVFKFDGEIKVLSCYVDRKGIKVKPTNIETWDRITTKWEDMTLEWDDYLMDLKINTEQKRLRQKEINKFEL